MDRMKALCFRRLRTAKRTYSSNARPEMPNRPLRSQPLLQVTSSNRADRDSPPCFARGWHPIFMSRLRPRIPCPSSDSWVPSSSRQRRLGDALSHKPISHHPLASQEGGTRLLAKGRKLIASHLVSGGMCQNQSESHHFPAQATHVRLIPAIPQALLPISCEQDSNGCIQPRISAYETP